MDTVADEGEGGADEDTSTPPQPQLDALQTGCEKTRQRATVGLAAPTPELGNADLAQPEDETDQAAGGSRDESRGMPSAEASSGHDEQGSAPVTWPMEAQSQRQAERRQEANPYRSLGDATKSWQDRLKV